MANTTKRTLNPDTNQFEDAIWQDGDDSPVTGGEPSIYFPNGGRTFLQSAVSDWQVEGEQTPAQKKPAQAKAAPAQRQEPTPVAQQPAQAQS